MRAKVQYIPKDQSAHCRHCGSAQVSFKRYTDWRKDNVAPRLVECSNCGAVAIALEDWDSLGPLEPFR